MSRYLVRFTALTTLRITESVVFGHGPTKVVVNNDATYDHSSAWPNRLVVSVETEAGTIESAIGTGKEVAEITILLLVTSTSASTDICRFDRAIDYDNGIRDRLFRQEFFVPLSDPSTRELLPEKFEKFIRAISNTQNTLLYENIDRFTRSTRWYRKGLLEEDPLDQYLNYWTALEILEPLLNKKYNVPKDKIPYKCEKCKNIKIVERSSHKGISELVEKTGYQEAIAKDMRSTRDELVHGYKPFAKLIPKVEGLLPDLEKVVLAGLLEILDFSQNERQDFLREPHCNPGYPVQTLEIVFTDMPDSQLSIDSIPFFQCTPVSSEITTLNGSKTTGTLKLVFPHLCSTKNCKSWIDCRSDPEEPKHIDCELLVKQGHEPEGSPEKPV